VGVHERRELADELLERDANGEVVPRPP